MVNVLKRMRNLQPVSSTSQMATNKSANNMQKVSLGAFSSYVLLLTSPVVCDPPW
jgi:hypothetical protein